MALEGLAREVSETAQQVYAETRELRSKFDALLSTLSSSEGVD